MDAEAATSEEAAPIFSFLSFSVVPRDSNASRTFFPFPLPSSRENFVFVSYSTSMIRSLRYIDFVRIAKTERLERKQGERERGRGEERDGRVAGNRFSIKRAVYPSLGWFARTV